MINSMHSLIFGSHFDWPFSKLKILYVVWIAILATTACLRKRQWNPMDTVHVKSIQVWILEQTFWINFRASKLVWVDCTPSRALAGLEKGSSLLIPQLATALSCQVCSAAHRDEPLGGSSWGSSFGQNGRGEGVDQWIWDGHRWPFKRRLYIPNLFICPLWFHKATKPIHKSRFIVLIMRLTIELHPTARTLSTALRMWTFPANLLWFEAEALTPYSVSKTMTFLSFLGICLFTYFTFSWMKEYLAKLDVGIGRWSGGRLCTRFLGSQVHADGSGQGHKGNGLVCTRGYVHLCSYSCVFCVLHVCRLSGS